MEAQEPQRPDRRARAPRGLGSHVASDRSDASACLTSSRLTRAAAGVEDRVRHLGLSTRAALAALYRRAELLVFPSLYEGFGTPPLEAMACGCPVASSREGSLSEVCGDAAAFFDARSAESIAGVVDVCSGTCSSHCARAMRGLAWAARFTWRAAAERHVEVYRRAAAMRS